MIQRADLTDADILKLAAEAGVLPVTVRAYLRGRSVKPLSVLRLQRACRLLGIVPAEFERAADGPFIR